jgi:hypothetical protein
MYTAASDAVTRYRVRFGAALANAAVRVGPVCVAVVLLVLIVGVAKRIVIGAEELTLLLGIFGGAFVLTSLGMSISQRLDWFQVNASGLTYRVPGGLGSATLVMKKMGEVPWDAIADVTSSRFLPYRVLHLRIERSRLDGARRDEFLELPLYLREKEEFVQAILSHAPQGHPLCAALHA